MKPTIGRIVLYVLSASDAESINNARAHALAAAPKEGVVPPGGIYIRTGNQAVEGDIYPADVVRVFGEGENPPINLQVKLDGNDSHWATSRHNDDAKTPGTWHWMEYQKQQAASEVPAYDGPLTVEGSGVAGATPLEIHNDEPAESDSPPTDESKPTPTEANPSDEEATAEEKLKAEVGF